MDERERELERRFQASRATDDEAAWLRERLRAGRLPEERLRIAAIVGHPAAALALGHEPPREPEPLAAALEACGRETALRALVALGRLALPEWEGRFPRDVRPRVALEAAEGEARCPCPRHREVVQERLGGVGEARAAARQVRAQRAAQAAHLVHFAAGAALAPGSPADLRAALLAAGDLEPPSRVRAALRAALTPWALERGDPLA